MRILIVALFIFSCFSATPQTKKRGKVKRKYRVAKQANTELPRVFLRGSVYDIEYQPIAGATVSIDATAKAVNTNSEGEFFIDRLMTGRVRIRVSFIGYQTRTVDMILREGQNVKDIMLLFQDVHLEPERVTATGREQQLLDVPLAVEVINSQQMEENNLVSHEGLNAWVPGVFMNEPGLNSSFISVRGWGSNATSTTAPAKAVVFFAEVPLMNSMEAVPELYDMAAVEVLRGPQNTLLGSNAQSGAILYVPKMPGNSLQGYLTSGIGNYGQKEIQGAGDLPLAEGKLAVRLAGLYRANDGYVQNTFGGRLMGKQTLAGRMAVRFSPQWNHKIELLLNVQNDEAPGWAIMSARFPNTLGETGIYSGTASLEQGRRLGSSRELANAVLKYRYYINENNYWNVITAYSRSEASALWDGDGTAAEAIIRAEQGHVTRFYQEIRGNFSTNGRMNGSLGASYSNEKARQTEGFSANEQYLAQLLIPGGGFVDDKGQALALLKLPDSLGGAALPAFHAEEDIKSIRSWSLQGFLNFDYHLSRKLWLSAGGRVMYNRYRLLNEMLWSDGEASVLGTLTGYAPNLLALPANERVANTSELAYMGRGGIQYRPNEYGSVFLNVARGRTPKVVQFNAAGEEEIIDAETLDNVELGMKGTFADRIFLHLTGFYNWHRNFQAQSWVADTTTGTYNLITGNYGRARSYGTEASLEVALAKGVRLRANYAWLHTAFDSTDAEGSEQLYAGKVFRRAPQHRFTVGTYLKTKAWSGLQFFLNPNYTYSSAFFFDDANTPELEQPGVGWLVVNGGIHWLEPDVLVVLWGNNLLDEHYAISGGNKGALSGVPPTFVPGAPRMWGMKVSWRFAAGKKRRFRR